MPQSKKTGQYLFQSTLLHEERRGENSKIRATAGFNPRSCTRSDICYHQELFRGSVFQSTLLHEERQRQYLHRALLYQYFTDIIPRTAIKMIFMS